VSALHVASPLLLVQLIYLRKCVVFFDGSFFGVVEIYKHCNRVVICISYCGTERFVAECCSINNLKNGFENVLFFFLPNFCL